MAKRVALAFLLLLSAGRLSALPNIVIVNTDPGKEVLLNVRKNPHDLEQVSVKPLDTLRLALVEGDAWPLLLICGSPDMKFLTAVAMPGDTVYYRRYGLSPSFEAYGTHSRELALTQMVTEGPLKLAGPTEGMASLGKAGTYEAFLADWLRSRELGEEAIARFRADSGVRGEVSDYFARALRARLVSALLTPVHFPPFPQQVAGLPQAYRDTVAAAFGRVVADLERVPPRAVPEAAAYLLRSYAKYLSLTGGGRGGTEELFAIAKGTYGGYLREMACYLTIRVGQDLHEQVQPLVDEFCRTVAPHGTFAAKLSGVQRLNSVNILADATLNDPLEGSRGDTRLFDLIKANRGKVIYIDYWASWCRPCLEEMPSSVALAGEYPEKDLAVLFLSVDGDRSKWLAAGGKLLPGGTHSYRLTEGEKSGMAKAFGLQGVPRYMLVDRQGVVRYADAPRPSEPALRELLGKMLQPGR